MTPKPSENPKSEDPQLAHEMQQIADRGAQARKLSDFGTTAPSGEQNGERMGHATIDGEKRLYFRCPDGEWCHVVLT